jgi:hypothetical protein
MTKILEAAIKLYPIEEKLKELPTGRQYAAQQQNYRTVFFAGHAYTMEAYGVEEMAKALRELVDWNEFNQMTLHLPIICDNARAALNKYDSVTNKN